MSQTNFLAIEEAKYGWPYVAIIGTNPFGLGDSSGLTHTEDLPARGTPVWKMQGYSRLGMRMSSNPDLAIFRRFAALNAQNLLYLQAELTSQEKEIRKKEQEDSEANDDERKEYAHDWGYLCKDTSPGSQWQKFKELRDLLRQYNDALLLQHQLSKLAQPRDRSLNVLNSVLNNASTTEYLLGLDSATWSDSDIKHDLVAVNDLEHVDSVSLWSTQASLKMIKKLCGSRIHPVDGIVNISDETLARPSFIISTLVSSLLPVSAIVVLYLVRNMAKRLVILAVFTGVFSVGMATLTSARRGEIFAATSTFAAVQVVFIGTNH